MKEKIEKAIRDYFSLLRIPLYDDDITTFKRTRLFIIEDSKDLEENIQRELLNFLNNTFDIWKEFSFNEFSIRKEEWFYIFEIYLK